MLLFLFACAAESAATDTSASWDAGYEKGWEEAQVTIDELQASMSLLQDAVDAMGVRVEALEDEADTTITGWALIKSNTDIEISVGDWISGVEQTATGRYTVTVDWRDLEGSPLCVATIHQEGAEEWNASVYGSGDKVYVSTGTTDGTAEDKSFVLSCSTELE